MTLKYKGKLFSVLGDSVSTLDGYNPPEYGVFYEGANRIYAEVFTPSDTWWGAVIERLGAKLLVNNSYAGTTVCKHPLSETESHASSDERTATLSDGCTDPDVVMIFMGLNDYGYGLKIGTAYTLGELGSFSSAYRTMLRKIKERHSRVEIWCLTLPRGDKADTDSKVARLDEYSSAIRECAVLEGCRLFDVAKKASGYSSLDGYHPTREGMMTIAEALIADL